MTLFARIDRSSAVTIFRVGTIDSNLERVGDAALTAQWSVKRQTLFFYEIDTEALTPLIAAPLETSEVRPGISLLAVECLHYRSGHFRRESPEAFEMVVAAVVHPDLSVDMPVPRFALQILSVVTDSKDFVENERRLLSSPIVHVPNLRMEFSNDGTSVDVFDGDEVVVSCHNTDVGATPPVFETKVLWGLTYSTTEGLQRGIFRWQGDVNEHMKPGDYGEFHPHAAFAGIDTRRIRGCYRQMTAREDGATDIRYYHLGPTR
jgi:hypothetical protein